MTEQTGRTAADRDHEATTEAIFAALVASPGITVLTESGYEPSGDISIRSELGGYNVKIVPA